MMSHSFFLWGSYGATALVIAVELIGLVLRRKRALAEAKSRL
jgi:heme exporter protein CcmD